MKNEIVLFETEDKEITIPVNVSEETVWLSIDQMAELFQRDRSVIGKHVRNIFKEGELQKDSVWANFAYTAADGKAYNVDFYDLDVIISVGYRVKSQRGIEFRRWANQVLKQYIMRGYVINEKRVKDLGIAIQLLKRSADELDTKQVLDVIERYNVALDLLDDYDHQTIRRPEGTEGAYVLTYEECRQIIDDMKFSGMSSIFGQEKDESFKGTIGNIYQSFSGFDIYPSIEEKAANLLYLITKNHCFIDGNKRIAAALFLYFLDKNGLLFDNNRNKLMDDHTLVALTIMIAESLPKEKETMISIIMNCIYTSNYM